jgi:protein-S-isoprenylcysteine O-methyltransferase Ste14
MPGMGYSSGVFFDILIRTPAIIVVAINMRDFNWSNIPIPESHVVPLVVGVVLHVWLPLKLFEITWLKYVLGWPLLLLGGLYATWATVTISSIDISRPTRIIDTGPYKFSRNPIYVAWTLIYIGITILVNTWWLVVFLPAVIVITHYVVRREERQLEQRFNEEYRQYCDRVRRYL